MILPPTLRQGVVALLAGGLIAAAGLPTVAAQAAPSAEARATPAAADPTVPGPVKAGAAASSAKIAAAVGSQKAALDKLGDHDRALLADAQAAKLANVTVVTTTAVGRTSSAVASLKALGASIGHVDDKLGYVRATVPTGKVIQAAGLASLQRVDINEVLPLPDPKVASPSASRSSASVTYPAPSATTPDANPYMPTSETGAVAFRKAHPTYDGRGVTVGILDTGVDLDHPALATTTTGERKIVDWVTATDPLVDGDLSWRAMLTSVTGPSATYQNETWTLPTSGTYRISLFRESVTEEAEGLLGDVNRDGDTTDVFGVLYDEDTQDIWVDSDGDHDFTDGPAMRPYKEDQQVGHFGTDDAATAVREDVPFVVEFRRNVDLTPAGMAGQTADFVNIGIVAAAHGTHVAGIATARSLFGGTMNGAAPGAKIVSSRACVFSGGCTTVALIEGLIDLVANRGVDVVNISIGGLPALNDGNNARAAIYERLIAEYGVQLVISAGNSGPAVNTVGDPSVVSSAISVAAGASKATWAANYHTAVTALWWVQNYSSHGPREDGGFKPNVIAPGSAISSIPSFMEAEDLAEAGYTLPPGYSMFNGTSMAAPEVTGVAALLLSGAKARDLAIVPKQLREAIYSSATFVRGLSASAQGNGLVNTVAAAKKLYANPNVTYAYAVSAPVCSVLADKLLTPKAGPGLYNRCSAAAGGQAVGTSRTYNVTITRTSGSARAGFIPHTLRWLGNDGTFSSPSRVNLPLRTPVTIKVRATPMSSGEHAAILSIDSVATPLIDTRMMASVVVSQSLRRAPFSQSVKGAVERVRTTSYFVDVPVGAKSLQVNLGGIAAGSQVRWVATNPYGVPEDVPTVVGSCFTNHTDPALCPPTSRFYEDPLPGVWELEVEARRTTPYTRNPFTLKATVQGVVVTPEVTTVPSATAGQPVPLEWTVTNPFGAATVSGASGPLGSALTASPTITQGQVQTTTVDVPAGATELSVSIGNTSDLGADLDLYVRDANGEIVGQSADGDSDEEVTIDGPPAGTYTITVEGFTVAAAGSTYDYRDAFRAPALGSLTVSSPPIALSTGGSTVVKGSLTALLPAGTGRTLSGTMKVVSSDQAVLGTGIVNVVALN